MAGQLLTVAPPALNPNANPYSGAKWRFYESGTTTPLAVYADADLSVSLGETVTADSAGRFVPIYLNSQTLYRAVLKSADDSDTLSDVDPVNPGSLNDFASSNSGKGWALVGAGLSMADPPPAKTVAASAFKRRVQAGVDYGLPADALDASGNVAVIQSVLDGLETQGGGTLELPRGWAGHHDEMIEIRGQNVGIEGQGGRENINNAGIGAEASTALIYSGTGDIEASIKLHTPLDPGNVQRIGGGVRGVSIDGGNKTGFGVYCYGRSDFTLEQMFVTGVRTCAYMFDGPDASQLADAYGTQGAVLRNLTARLVDGGAQDDAHGFDFTGARDRNFSFNHVEMCDALTLDGDGFIYDNCDTNLFSMMRGLVGGTGWAMTCQGGYRVDGEYATTGALPSPPMVPWPIGTTYLVTDDGSYRRWNGASYDVVTVPANQQLGSVGCFGNTFIRPSWFERASSPGMGNIRWRGHDDGYWQPAEANHFIDVDDGNASLLPAYISSDAGAPRNRIGFTFEPRDLGAIYQRALFGGGAGGLRYARQRLVAGMPATFVEESGAFLQLLSTAGAQFNIELEDAATLRARSPSAAITAFLFSGMALGATGYKVGANQVVGARGGAITNPSGGGTIDSEARTAIIAILTAMRNHGLIAT